MVIAIMEETIGQRILKFLELRGISQRELARLSGVERVYINQLIHGKAKSVGIPIAQKLARGLDISVSELIGEEIPNSENSSINEAAESIIEKILEKYEKVETIKIPIRGSVPAGIPSMQEESIEDYIEIPKSEIESSTKKEINC